MDEVERINSIKNIERVIPVSVFNRFIALLALVNKSSNNNALVCALGKTAINPSYTFAYRMSTGDPEDKITPIREILDLCEGWFITSVAQHETERVVWHVKSIIDCR